MDEKESNKRENSMLGPQGTGHAQIFAKGDSPLAVSGAEISRLQPEGHQVSRDRKQISKYEFRISRVLLPAVLVHFSPRRESKNCSRERSCRIPCKPLKHRF